MGIDCYPAKAKWTGDWGEEGGSYTAPKWEDTALEEGELIRFKKFQLDYGKGNFLHAEGIRFRFRVPGRHLDLLTESKSPISEFVTFISCEELERMKELMLAAAIADIKNRELDMNWTKERIIWALFLNICVNAGYGLYVSY